jgi:flagellar motor switch protein FliN
MMSNQVSSAGDGPRGAAPLSSSFAKVKVTVQVMVGSTRMTLADMLDLKAGSSIMLDQQIGETVSVIVNNCLVAKGELYVLEHAGNKLGVKITEIIDASAGAAGSPKL